MIEIYTRNFDLHITVPSPNLAFLSRNLDYKPYSIMLQDIIHIVCESYRIYRNFHHCTVFVMLCQIPDAVIWYRRPRCIFYAINVYKSYNIMSIYHFN